MFRFTLNTSIKLRNRLSRSTFSTTSRGSVSAHMLPVIMIYQVKVLEIINFPFFAFPYRNDLRLYFRVPPRVPLAINLLLWAISLSIMFIIIFGVPGGKLSLVTTSLYVSFGHLGKYHRSRRFLVLK
jgi:hypothetical protein